MTAAARSRLAAMLHAELDALDLRSQCDRAETMAVGIDHGIGLSAIAAIAALPPGPARTVEARQWVQRAHARGIETIATLIVPNMTDAELDAVIELHTAILEAA